MTTRPAGVAAAALLAALGTACTVWPAAHEAEHLPLLPPQGLGGSLERQQIVRVAHGASAATFQCVLRVTPSEVVLIGLTPLGPRAFSLSWDGRELKSDVPAKAGGAPPPERMLADLQLAYWPLPVLEAATAGTGWQVSEPQPAVRRVLRGGELYAEIHYAASGERWDGRLWLVNFAQRYSLDIDSRALQ